MWIMVITMLYYGDPIQGHFSPAITSMEFKSKSSCEAGKKSYLDTMAPIAQSINRAIEDKRKVGEIRDPTGVVISAMCVEK